MTCSDEAKPLCKSPNFRNTSPSFGTHSPLNSRLWVMAIPSPLLSFFSPLARRAPPLDGANPSKLLLTYALSFPFPSSLFGSYLRMYYYFYWKRSLASTPPSILAAAAAASLIAAPLACIGGTHSFLRPKSVRSGGGTRWRWRCTTRAMRQMKKEVAAARTNPHSYS